ncbi:MAG: DUF1667 domain-containing protein [Acutalibacteraceae bacterium]
MKQLVCIVCPRGCTMEIEGEGKDIKVSGNFCKRGAAFAVSEMTEPKRTICSTVKTAFAQFPVLPVRVSQDIPKDRIFDVMAEINKVTVKKAVKRGDIIIKNVLGLGADVIATSSALKEIK